MSFGINNVAFRSRLPAGNVGQLNNIWNAGKIQSTDVEDDSHNNNDQIYYSAGRNLWVTGNIPFFYAATGACTGPSYSFDSDQDTGMHLTGADHLGFAMGGECQVDFSATGANICPPVLGSTGSASAPQYSYKVDPDTGMYRVAANDLGFTTGGLKQLNITTAIVESQLPIHAPTGAVGAPSYSFAGDPNTGLYVAGASPDDELHLVVSGSEGLVVASGDIVCHEHTVPALDMTYDLGTGANRWRHLVAGTGSFGNVIASTGSLSVGLFGDGTVSDPSISFTSDPNTGLYNLTADTLGFSAGGARQLSLDGSEHILWAGPTSTASAIRFTTATTPDYTYIQNSDQFDKSSGSPTAGAFSTIRFSAYSSTESLFDITHSGVQAPTGLATYPAYGFESDPDTGMYRVAANDLGFTTGGAAALSMGTGDVVSHHDFVPLTDITYNLGTGANKWLGVYGSRIWAESGAAGTPAYTFCDSTEGSGMYLTGEDAELAFATEGAKRFSINTLDVVSSQQLVPAADLTYDLGTGANQWRGLYAGTGIIGAGILSAGDATQPSISFTGDDDTGIYHAGADNIAFATGGVVKLDIDSDSVNLSAALVGSITSSSGPGAVAITGVIHEITTTGTGDALTLANGTAGQILKVIYVAEGAGADTAVLTPTTLAGGATITFNDLGDGADLVYSATGGWYMLGGDAVLA